MHGLWYERTWLDLGREAVIHVVLSLLYVPAYRIRCATSMVIVTLIGFQHLASLFVNPDGFLTPQMVLPGSFVLALMGYIKDSPLLFFVGLYSCISKYNGYLNDLTTSSFRDEWIGSGLLDTANEILKLAIASVVWAAVYFLVPFAVVDEMLFQPFSAYVASSLSKFSRHSETTGNVTKNRTDRRRRRRQIRSWLCHCSFCFNVFRNFFPHSKYSAAQSHDSDEDSDHEALEMGRLTNSLD